MSRVFGVLWLVCLAARSISAQTPDPAPRPASAGVYTVEQAARGKDIFGTICAGCHNVGSQSGTPFSKRWNGALLSDLFGVMTDKMPKDDPGSLTPQETADVIAYLLKINDLAAGTVELPADPEQLKKIVIDLVK